MSKNKRDNIIFFSAIIVAAILRFFPFYLLLFLWRGIFIFAIEDLWDFILMIF